MKKIWSKALTTSVLAVSLILAGCGQGNDSAASTEPVEKKEITIGTTPGMFADMVRDSIRPQLEQKGYTLKLVEFSDYVQIMHWLKVLWILMYSNTNHIWTYLKSNIN